jgi:hypothetical protein
MRKGDILMLMKDVRNSYKDELHKGELVSVLVEAKETAEGLLESEVYVIPVNSRNRLGAWVNVEHLASRQDAGQQIEEGGVK